ncbi:ABC transporter ATP-binding protein [Vibrio marisflavi]|uniref:Vitamin B12 import ATP-binding protein BtuD n=1 Tax=Vibrio marisflavi CECT 7928 TaxID=634439 RepID=A0ABM9A1R6_9VIBR|nr:ABC transporter ATP-binding protein [Vibrio marisflavi]CAH0537805.1 Vitamin B12 import ATP-binding protein BtuD [Vibrio marisflavi CECT 7928]
MKVLVEASRVSKQYKNASSGNDKAIINIGFQLKEGQVLGLLGHNGAGKSTLIKSLLGAQSYSGEIKINGLSPTSHRTEIMKSLSYISDTSTLPNWMTVQQLLKYTAGVSQSFRLETAKKLLSDTDIGMRSRIGALSKGMKVQLHLAIVIAADANVLILDEPTLGLDLMYRDVFYRNLMNWFQQGGKSLIIASHEVDEIEKLLTDVLILKQGRMVLNDSIESLQQKYTLIEAANEYSEQVKSLHPIYSRPGMSSTEWLVESQQLNLPQEVFVRKKASLADIFLAFQQGEKS